MKKLILAFMLTFSASAGFLIEPYAAYRLGSYENSSNNGEWSYDSPQLGARLGYTFATFMGGLDYSFGSADFKADSANTADDGKWKETSLAVFAGVELPVLLRAWASYFVKQEFEDDEGADAGTTISGDGFGFGVGFTGLPFVSINLEYRTFSYDEAESNTGTKTSIDTKSSEILLGVSLPLDL